MASGACVHFAQMLGGLSGGQLGNSYGTLNDRCAVAMSCIAGSVPGEGATAEEEMRRQQSATRHATGACVRLEAWVAPSEPQQQLGTSCRVTWQ